MNEQRPHPRNSHHRRRHDGRANARANLRRRRLPPLRRLCHGRLHDLAVHHGRTAAACWISDVSDTELWVGTFAVGVYSDRFAAGAGAVVEV